MSNTFDKWGGKARKTAGRLLGNKQMEAKGLFQEEKARLREEINRKFG